MTISVKVVTDSICSQDHRLTTLQMRYPRMIHAEFMTHRVFSRNASSSRAIPVERMIQDVLDDPAMPVSWGSNKPGMQAGEENNATMEFLNFEDGLFYTYTNRDAWLWARDRAVEAARVFAKAGYHKQIVNRLLEPFGHISVVCTATEWDNFFELRCHPDADPTMRALAEAMRDAMSESVPAQSDWHLPYVATEQVVSAFEKDGPDSFTELALISAARCARVSYLNHDGTKPDFQKDIALADRLLSSKHMSPFEHQAKVTGEEGTRFWGNFNGWDQFRKMVE